MRRCAAASAHETTQPDPLIEGESEVEASLVRHRKIEDRVVSPQAFEVTVRDQKPAEATVWTTVIRAVANDTATHTLVENSMESDDLTLRVSVGRPKVVHELLRAATKPVLGGSALLT